MVEDDRLGDRIKFRMVDDGDDGRRSDRLGNRRFSRWIRDQQHGRMLQQTLESKAEIVLEIEWHSARVFS